jgi:hypothetical protein
MRIKTHSYLILTFLIVVTGSGCEKALMPKDQNFNATEIFELLWNDIHEKYSYFAEKQIDWQEIKTIYEPQIHDQMDEYELFEILGDLLAELRDGHVNLLSTFNRSRNWEWYENFPVNYNEQLILDNYLGTDYRIIGPMWAQSVEGMLYVSYRSFERKISQQNMDEIIRLMNFHDGLIIDVRNNGGGSLQNGINMTSRFIDSRMIYAQQRFKSGPGISDFTPWTNMSVSPSDGAKYMGKIAVLTNRRSYSASTFFAQMMKTLPQAQLFGDQTGGGGGIPAYAELPNGWTYRFSATQTIDMADYHIEFGVLPDHVVVMDPIDEQQGKDIVIEAALEWLKQ